MAKTKRNPPSERTLKATQDAREEARAASERKRSEAREMRAKRRKERSRRWDLRTERLTVRLRSPGLASRRRAAAKAGPPGPFTRLFALAGKVLGPLITALAPAGRAAANGLSRAAPYISKTLMFAIRLPVALIAIGLDLVLDAVGWARTKVGPLSAGVYDLAMRTVTPVRTLVVVCVGAAVALALSQFADYRGIAVSAPAYEGEIGTVAPAPFTDLKPAGSAHFYALIPLAAVAVLLTVATARGRWRLGRAVGLIGLVGIVLGIAVDAPQGLDAGKTGLAYLGTDARLIEGFWAQMAASATLLIAGPLLGLSGSLRCCTSQQSQRRRPLRRGP